MSSKPPASQHAISTERVRSIVAESFNDEIDEHASEMISELMDDMLDSIVDWSIKVADAKGTNVLDVQDVRFICEQEWGLSVKSSAPNANSGSK